MLKFYSWRPVEVLQQKCWVLCYDIGYRFVCLINAKSAPGNRVVFFYNVLNKFNMHNHLRHNDSIVGIVTMSVVIRINRIWQFAQDNS